jgi:hypothetical protein
MELFVGLLERAVGEFKCGIARGDSVAAIGVLNCINVVRCCGGALPPNTPQVEKDWPPQPAQDKKDLTEDESRGLAFASLAASNIDLALIFIGGGALPQRFRPGEKFQFNVQGFVRYLAAAIRQRATAEDIEPAWRDFIDCFPRKLASGTLDWIDLMWAARVVMVHFEHRPVNTAAEALHKLVA